MSDTRWDALEHAYGPASNIPGLLEHARRAPASRTYTDEPWFSLWTALCHQSDVYTASYAAVPELVDIAEARSGDRAAVRDCLLLAGVIELERARPEHERLPPALPPELRTAYISALAKGERLARVALNQEMGPEHQRAFKIAVAAFSGNFDEARTLLDGPEESELEDD